MPGITEAIIGSVVGAIAKPVFQSLWQGGEAFVGQVGEKTRQLIFNASKQYGQNYQKRHGLLRVLGMQEPISLESVYTTVQFLAEEELQEFASIQALEAQFRNAGSRRPPPKKRAKRSGLKVANEKPYLMVLGGPGAGKSTFLKRIGLEALKGKEGTFQHGCIPVLIELKDFRTDPIDLQSKIVEEFETCNFPEPQRFTEEALKQGRLLILLDGLDEVPRERQTEAIDKIQDFVDRYSKNRFIASCRLAARRNFPRFTDVAIAEFDDKQIQTFITNWFQAQPERGQECWQKLSHKDYAAAKELSHTPLLLTLVCLSYQRAGQFPANRATLYDRALRVLLEEWAGEKNIPHEQIYKGLDTRRKELLLAKIAHDAFQKDRLFLPGREIAEQIEEFLKDKLPDETSIDGAYVLKSIEVQHGVLIERAHTVYSFSHLTIQEFLTAQYIYNRRQIPELVTQHLTSTRWREVFLLVAGLMYEVDELLLEIEKQAQTYVQLPKLQRLLRWSTERATGLPRHHHSTTERAMLIFFALVFALDYPPTADTDPARTLVLVRALGRACDRYRSFDANLECDVTRSKGLDLTRDIAFDRSLAVSFDHELAVAHTLAKLGVIAEENCCRLVSSLEKLKVQPPAKEMSQRMRQAWFEALVLPPELKTLSSNELNAFNGYLFATLLMMQCKEAALDFTSKTWSEIEARLLKPQFSPIAPTKTAV